MSNFKSKILTPLLNASHFLTIEEIIAHNQITKRTFFYQLKQLNNWLADDLNLEPVESIRNIGYFLPESTKKALNDQMNTVNLKPQLSIKIRQNNIIFMLINNDNPISLNNFAEFYQVSKKTIISDFKTIEANLPNTLTIEKSNKGHTLLGSEQDKRSLIFQFMGSINSTQYNQFNKKSISNMLLDFEKATGNKLSQASQSLLVKYFSWYFMYISNESHRLTTIVSPSNNILGIQWANKILNKYVHISSLPEANYLVNTIFQTQLTIANEDYGYKQEMTQIAEKIVHRFSNISGIEFKDLTLINHLATHLITAYYRINNQQPVNDLELKSVFINYRQLIRLTDYAIMPFRKIVNYPVSQNELALISLYFGGALENQVLPTDFDQSLILVVCGNGLGTSQILRQQLQKLYPYLFFKISFDDLSENSKDIKQAKLIISTVTIEKSYDVPVIIVHPLPTEQDLYTIRQKMIQLKLIHNNNVETLLDIIDTYCKVIDYNGLRESLNDYLNPIDKPRLKIIKSHKYSLIDLLGSRIQHKSEVLTLPNALQLVNKPLVRDKITTDQYANDILQLINTKGLYMMLNKNILLAHGQTNASVLGTGFSILTLDQPIMINQNNYTIDIIICFATINESAHLQGLSDLLKIITDPQKVAALRNSVNQNDILNLL
ncbi:PTS sugar transporter subunit IIA [Weissella kandleri]|uniref:PTS sugar transporter subunit IIA n=1 Tax=Weissella kandleri TaxID=1616 RepID=UPI00387E81F9